MTINKKIEVTKEQYGIIKSQFKGVVMFREENNKYFIKIVVSGYTKEIYERL